MFRDRREAGRQLARALDRYRGAHPLVLGLPRGGVVVGAEIARALDGELDVMLVKKLRTPANAELAMGAVTENGHVALNREVMAAMEVDEQSLEQEIAERRSEMARQRERYGRLPASPTDRQ